MSCCIIFRGSSLLLQNILAASWTNETLFWDESPTQFKNGDHPFPFFITSARHVMPSSSIPGGPKSQCLRHSMKLWRKWPPKEGRPLMIHQQGPCVSVGALLQIAEALSCSNRWQRLFVLLRYQCTTVSSVSPNTAQMMRSPPVWRWWELLCLPWSSFIASPVKSFEFFFRTQACTGVDIFGWWIRPVVQSCGRISWKSVEWNVAEKHKSDCETFLHVSWWRKEAI